MRTFVVLLRGINVGSTRKPPMADLRALCTKVGWKRPETYIQSGNLIVDADDAADNLRRSLEKAVAARFGFAVDIVVRAAADWEKYVAANVYGLSYFPAQNSVFSSLGSNSAAQSKARRR